MDVIGFAGPMGSGKDTAASSIARRKATVIVALADPLKRMATEWFGIPHDNVWGTLEQKNAPLATPIDAQALAHAKTFADKLVALTRGEKSEAEVLAAMDAAFLPHLPIRTARKLMQEIGTGLGRSLSPDLWLMSLHDVLRALRHGAAYTRQGGIDLQRGALHTYDVTAVPDVRFPNEAKYIKEVLGGSVVWIESGARVARPEGFAHASEPTYEALAPWVTHVVKNETTVEDFEEALRVAV